MAKKKLKFLRVLCVACLCKMKKNISCVCVGPNIILHKNPACKCRYYKIKVHIMIKTNNNSSFT